MFIFRCLKSSTNQAANFQTPQYGIDGNKVSPHSVKLTSKDVQTDVDGDEVEKLRDFHDKHLEKQLKVDVTLR